MEGMFTTGSALKLACYLKIAKIPLCLLVAFSSFFGYLYSASLVTVKAVLLFCSVLVLACGAATLNSYQERNLDGLMQRTKNRPLVRGEVSENKALMQAVILIPIGLISILSFTPAAFIMGVLAVILYNLIYTRLKSRTLLAIIPGAIGGALPPYIGWLAAGGEVMSFQGILPVFLLLFWQVPHFLLVMLNHKLDYASTLLPNILKRLSESSLQRIFLPWIAALTVTMLIFTVLPSSMSNIERLFIIINGVVLFGLFSVQLMFIKPPNYSYLFKHLNFSIFLLMLIICCGALT